MITLKRIIAAVAVGAAIAISGVLPGSAASLSGSAPTSVLPDGQSAGKSDDITLVRERGGGGPRWRSGGGGRAWSHGGRKTWGHNSGGRRWSGGKSWGDGGSKKWSGGSGKKWSGGGGKHWGDGGKWKHRGNRRRHYSYSGLYISPFLYGYDYYDYGYSGYYVYDESCYRECRYENGPRYCRKFWRYYC